MVSTCAAAPPLAGLKTPLLTGLVMTLLPVADRPRPEAQLLVHLLMAAPLLVTGSPEAAGPRSSCIVECLRLCYDGPCSFARTRGRKTGARRCLKARRRWQACCRWQVEGDVLELPLAA